MENAAKALTIAGEILISIMIISAAILMYNQLSAVPDQEKENKRQEQIVAFNNEYESYNRKDLYGSDIISLVNKMLNNNRKYEELGEGDNYKIEIKVILTMDDDFFGKKNTTYNKLEDLQKILNTASSETTTQYYHPYTDFKRKMFKCTATELNKDTGRIKSMTFEQLDLSSQNS